MAANPRIRLGCTAALLLVLSACAPQQPPAATPITPNPLAPSSPESVQATPPIQPTVAPTATSPLPTPTMPTPTIAPLQPSARAAEQLLWDFVQAINRGDEAATAELFAPEARFDRAGTVFQGRDQIMQRFLAPDVIRAQGQYEVIGVQLEPALNRATFEFHFRAGSLFEHFTYQCTARDGVLQECMGRYVQPGDVPLPTPATRPQPTLPAAAHCYFDAIASNDAGRAADCFTTDGVVIDVSRRIAGRAAIERWVSNEVLGGEYRILEVTPTTEGVRVLLNFTPRGSTSGFNAYYTFTIQDEKIKLADLQYA